VGELGSYALLLGLLVSFIGIAAGLFAGIQGRDDWTRIAERSMLLVFGATSVAMIALFWALATNDFTLSYVAAHSARTMPLHYRLGALWGGQAGSLLLWGWMLSAYGAAAVFGNRTQNRSLMPWVCVAMFVNIAFFLLLTNFESLPFDPVPHDQRLSDGNGLNPLLQHPVMLIHPVVLYAGFTGFALPFAFAFAALVTGQLGTTWFRTTRRWTLFAWTFLSAGVMLGGRWAYEVLGWGGYWAWDPVENASLMPWIAGTAYIHSVMIQEKRDMLRTWNIVLIGLTYGLCLFGTFLTRSGIVQSVHAFANSESFGRIFLSYVVIMLVAFIAALIWRLPMLRSPNKLESVISREASFIINNWIFMAILFVVFVGTLFPVFTEALGGARRILGPPRDPLPGLHRSARRRATHSRPAVFQHLRGATRLAASRTDRHRPLDRLAQGQSGESAPTIHRARQRRCRRRLDRRRVIRIRTRLLGDLLLGAGRLRADDDRSGIHPGDSRSHAAPQREYRDCPDHASQP